MNVRTKRRPNGRKRSKRTNHTFRIADVAKHHILSESPEARVCPVCRKLSLHDYFHDYETWDGEILRGDVCYSEGRWAWGQFRLSSCTTEGCSCNKLLRFRAIDDAKRWVGHKHYLARQKSKGRRSR